MEVGQHMSATQLKKILHEREPLNPERSKVLLRVLKEDLASLSSSTAFEEAYFIYHTDDAIFYPYISSSGSYWGFAFLNKRFILNVDMGRCFQNHITISFHGNTNKPINEDKKIIIDQLFSIIENGEIFLLEDITRDNIDIDFMGV